MRIDSSSLLQVDLSIFMDDLLEELELEGKQAGLAYMRYLVYIQTYTQSSKIHTCAY